MSAPRGAAGLAAARVIPGASAANMAVPKTENALANLRARALDLQARLLELSDAVAMLRDGVGAFRNAPWSAFLAKYETLAKLFMQLTEELDRAVINAGFQSYILRPRAAAEDPDLVPNMLRTRLEPEVEADLMELQAEYEREAAGALDVGAGSLGTVEGERKAAEVLKRRVEQFNFFIEGALERYDDARDIDLSDPRPPEPPAPTAPPKGQGLLNALMTGAPI